MLPLLLVLDGIIWYGVVSAYKHDKSTGPYPSNPNFDSDLDKLWDSEWIPSPSTPTPPEVDEKLIKQNFEAWLANEHKRNLTLEDFLWKEGILNPEEAIWCEGVPLSAYDAEDISIFIQIKDKAILEGIYNSKLLEEGGQHDLYKAWFMLKGCSDYGAEMLLASGVKPWEFEF